MKVFEVRNVNEALGVSIPYLLDEGVEEISRNGRVIVAPTPVCTVYREPKERVVFSRIRDANPFFHLMESLWMLAGRRDLKWIEQFNSRFGEYSDDGKSIWGAYGWRWKSFFGVDQIQVIISELEENPDSRRCVLSMWNAWDGSFDGHNTSSDLIRMFKEDPKDVPCNTHAYFDLRNNVLNMTICCRSNDIMWGAYGANAVHFSMLQEYIASALGVEVGVYRQISNNLHIYPDVYGDKQQLLDLSREAQFVDYYKTDPHMLPTVLVCTSKEDWDRDLESFMLQQNLMYYENFFNYIAQPMYNAYMFRKQGDYKAAYEALDRMPLCDWKIASIEWVQRREERKNARDTAA